jgi:hypothetical protein
VSLRLHIRILIYEPGQIKDLFYLYFARLLRILVVCVVRYKSPHGNSYANLYYRCKLHSDMCGCVFMTCSAHPYFGLLVLIYLRRSKNLILRPRPVWPTQILSHALHFRK